MAASTERRGTRAAREPFRVVSWNVNGLRSVAGKGFGAWLAGSRADVVALQETRARPEQVPAELRAPQSHPHAAFVAAERAGYSGVGLYARRPWDALETSLGVPELDVEGRLVCARFGALEVVNGYFPNGSGQDRDNSRVPYKLRFYERLFARLAPAFEAGAPLVVVGDFNTAPEEIDLARPKENAKTSGFLPEERDEVRRWLDAGWIDAFRVFEPGPGHYSWWSQRFGVRERNIGWRIDLALVSPGARPFLRGAALHPDVRGSDHCPLSVDLDPAVLEATVTPATAPSEAPTPPKPPRARGGARRQRGGT